MNQPLTDKRVPPRSSLADCLNKKVNWFRTEDPTALWRGQAGTETWTVRVNDFPREHLYTLFIDDADAGNFDQWPPQWSRAEEVSE
jgi:hypothetical protein